MDTITDNMQAFALSSTPSSLSSTADTLAHSSTLSSRRPSSATSISPAVSEAAMPSRKPSIDHTATTTNTTPTTSATKAPSTTAAEESILDDVTQGRTRALRRQALARKISAHLRTIPSASSSSSSSASSSSLDSKDIDCRRDYIDALAAREPEVYTPALAAYFADHIDDIPKRPEDAATRRRKRYDDYELITDRFGRTSRVDVRQARLFQGWGWDPEATNTGKPANKTKSGDSPAAASDQGPMGEKQRGEVVSCAHCERKERKNEVRKVAMRGLGKLLGRSSKSKLKSSGSVSEKKTGKAVIEDEADHAEQIEKVEGLPSAGTVRVQ